MTHELFLLHLGELHWKNPLTGVSRWHPVPAYLIRTPSGRQILVDTGNPVALVGKDNSLPFFDNPARIRPGDDLLHRLRTLDTSPAEIDVLVSSHFDFDHCGRHDLFVATAATKLVQKQHLEFARANELRCKPALWDLPGIEYEIVDGDFEFEPGITLMLTPGHVTGHQSLFVQTTARPVILAIDAIDDLATLNNPLHPCWYFEDLVQAEASRDRLVELADQVGAELLMGHEPTQWNALPHAPLPYGSA